MYFDFETLNLVALALQNLEVWIRIWLMLVPGLLTVLGLLPDDFGTSGATEIPADGIDQSCSGTDDCYQDLDQDSFGSTVVVTATTLDCSGPNESSTGGA